MSYQMPLGLIPKNQEIIVDEYALYAKRYIERKRN
jgi:hypothetical protein